VTVTLASLAHLTPRRIISIVPSNPFLYSFEIHSATDDIIELHAELELFSPLDTGISESTVSDQPSGSLRSKYPNVFFTHMRAMFVSSFGSFAMITERSDPETLN
jgi:hypothetical protein